ncbi:MAG: TonB-dependent receptor domain-containing protein [Chitinophagaceae bacterium]
MKHFSKLTLLIAMITFVSQRSGAQSVKGMIIDSLSRQTLANASVSLSKNGAVLHSLNATKGEFEFSGLDTASVYRLNIQYTGYRSFVLDSLKADQSSLVINLVPDLKEMTGVTVTASKPFIVQKNDKIVVNVAQSPIAAGGNVYEAVKKAPGVVDMQGLQFRGKNVTVYINDKPSRLGGEELKTYLSSMPANTVERVEVIPNPSAKYEASGGPVVNIILAKSKDLGTNGVLTAGAGAGKYGRYNGGVSLNHRNAGVNVYGSYDYQQVKINNKKWADRSFNNLYTIHDEQRSIESSGSHTAKLGMDYTINSRSSFGGLARGLFSDKDRDINNNSLVSTDSSSIVNNNNHINLATISANLYYRTKLGKTGDLSLNADYFTYNKDYSDYFTTHYYDKNGGEYGSPYLLRSNAPADNRIKSFSADYTFSAGNISYETGLKAVLTRTDNSSVWEKNEDGSWTNDELKSNRFVYDENIYAAYLSASRSISKFDLQAGLRMEYTDAKGYSVTLKQENKNNYASLFPSLTVSCNLSEKQQYSFSYRRRIERFGFDIVNPFIVYQNQYAYYQGNPDIKPSYSHNFELGWTYGNEWMASAEYGHFTDALAEVYKKNGNETAMISTYENIASADQVMLNLTYTKRLFKGKLTTSNSLGGLYAKYNAPENTGLSNAATSAFMSSSNMLSLGTAWKAELSAYYYSPMRLGAYDIRSQVSASAGFSRTLLNKKATLGLSISDIFNSGKMRYEVSSYGVKAFNKNMPETRFVKMTFTYRFGNKNVKAAKNRKTSIDDVKNRMGN